VPIGRAWWFPLFVTRVCFVIYTSCIRRSTWRQIGRQSRPRKGNNNSVLKNVWGTLSYLLHGRLQRPAGRTKRKVGPSILVALTTHHTPTSVTYKGTSSMVWNYLQTITVTLSSIYVAVGARCWWSSWLKQCATSRKVAGSIPDGVSGIFHWHNASGNTMALGLTQSLTEMSTGSISWGVKAAGA